MYDCVSGECKKRKRLSFRFWTRSHVQSYEPWKQNRKQLINSSLPLQLNDSLNCCKIHRLRPWILKFYWKCKIENWKLFLFNFPFSTLHFPFVELPRKEVIQPHLPVRLPCYDFTPVTNPALGRCFQKVSSRTSGVVDFHGVTGGVYKTRERIQRSVLICVY